ncbi:NAD-dependent epimerase/dehydratase family protein [Frateuria sp. YIM B11624]|uniref:NAD-dependent epimerase/dehydratase family protein n=1 Tax=Frateuria sp. YIM B11624 TaxID=3143185 RepID=UPI003C76549D
MRVFVAGGSGAIGKSLVPLLLAAGHEVVVLGRSAHKAEQLRALGAHVAVADAFDKAQLTVAIMDAKPQVVIHQLTAIPAAIDLRRFDEDFARTNRLRTEVTDVMLAAARKAGARRFIAQSFCGWPFAREGGPIKTEDAPLDPHPPAHFGKTLAALRYLEDAVHRAEGIEAIALRYGFLYGPGTDISTGGRTVELVRRRRIPLVGDGGGIWSFIHVGDAARATVAAVTRGDPGLYNIVDDEPAPVSSWLPALAEAVGAKRPHHVPAWLARLFIGEGGVSMMTAIRGGSNAKARRELAWRPAWPTWRRGFVEGLG